MIKADIHVIYPDDTSAHFVVHADSLTDICMITRGTLMTMGGYVASAYDPDGIELCTYLIPC